MEVFDNELHDYLSGLEETSECKECGTSIDEGSNYCSRDCYKASML